MFICFLSTYQKIKNKKLFSKYLQALTQSAFLLTTGGCGPWAQYSLALSLIVSVLGFQDGLCGLSFWGRKNHREEGEGRLEVELEVGWVGEEGREKWLDFFALAIDYMEYAI